MNQKPMTTKQKSIAIIAVLCIVAGCVAYWLHQEDLKATAAAAEAEAARMAVARLKAVTVKALQPERVYVRPTPPPPEPRPIVLEWQSFNPDTIGYLKIDDTRIDYPVLQGKDNDYYLNYTIDHIKATRGSIFLDVNVKFDPLDLPRHMLIHGHHMKDGSMFHNVAQYKTKDFFYKHPMIRFETLYLETIWEVFSVYICDANEYVPMSFMNDESYLIYLQKTRSRSMYDVDVDLTADDIILTLNTCSYEFSGAHTLVVAKLVEMNWLYRSRLRL